MLFVRTKKKPKLCIDCKHFAGNYEVRERPVNALYRDCIHPKAVRVTISIVDGVETTYCPSAWDLRENSAKCGIKARLFEAKL